ncbi:hypothetical protein [Pleurocapsa sp. FMAR1]|uniref:hypothetical protein n=1 Tax=Pleurocapsa sp. FMAR1 TaxID=3040204 RepID=UPI0029C616B4|nr:hypothetical protein [Pleurocapsa sp. FMAR1]
MNKPKYKIGDRIYLNINGQTVLSTIRGVMENHDSTGWKYGFHLGINYLWSDIWFQEEYLERECKRL